jgi:hypothetical protein
MKNKNKYNCIVVGSGFSAWSAINVLLKKKIKPILIDIGIEKHDKNLDHSLITKKIPLGYVLNKNKLTKLVNFIGENEIEILASVGFGGLSSLWGGSINKLHKNEFKAFPFNINVLDKYYRFVDSFFDQVGADDNLSKEYNLKILKKNTNQDLNFFKKIFLKGSKDLVFGQSRIATKKNTIFFLDRLLNKMIVENKIKYISNFKVEKIKEEKKKITLYSLDGNQIHCQKLYLACGSLESSRIILNSCDVIKSVTLRETKLISSLWFSKKKINFNKKNNFSDAYLNKVTYPFFSSQFYLIKNKIVDKFSTLSYLKYFFIKLILNLFKKRLIFILTYLDQDFSDRIKLIKNKDKIIIKYLENKKQIYTKISFIISYLFKKNFLQLIKIDKKKFGYGYHYGSSFPMSRNKNKNSSDILGRVGKFKNVHLIDSSVLSRIPTSTITYSVMANAARIVDLTANKVYK